MAAEEPSHVRSQFQRMIEFCDRCDLETDHRIALELRTENEQSKKAIFSREPYRLTECTMCGYRRSKRMNNA